MVSHNGQFNAKISSDVSLNVTDGDPDEEANPGHRVQVNHESDVGRDAQRRNEGHQRNFEQQSFCALLVRRYYHQRFVTNPVNGLLDSLIITWR